jgi:hypothetical protein
MKHKYKIIEYEPYYLHLDSLYELYDNDVKIWEGRCDSSLEELLTNLGIEYEYEVIERV